MYTVLLTDDEPAILKALSDRIPWQQFGVDTLLTAADGLEALDVMKNQRVDLLITDIRMPHMDGIELLHKVREKYPATHCILLTAYSEFEYARTAMHLGVENYLLKPFQKEEMEATIEKALENIYTSRENSKHLFRNNILLRWAAGTISSEELGERSGLLDINIYLPEYMSACIRKKQKGSLSAYCSACVEELSGDYEVHQFWDDKGRYVFIIGGDGLETDRIAKTFSRLAKKLGMENLIALSLGSAVSDADTLSQSYKEACSLLETADLSVAGMQIFDQSRHSIRPDSLFIDKLNGLFHQPSEELRNEGYQRIGKELLPFFEKEETNPALFILSQSLQRLFLQEFPNRPEIRQQLYSRMHLFSIASLEDFHNSVVELLEYSYLLFNYYFDQLSPVIRQAIGYIHKHYADGISIKDLCVKTRMNQAYLGFLFKKETGMFFNNYLTQYRICCAIQLLKNSDMKINDIAGNVGFSSASYFVTSFKKQTGISPVKYRVLKQNLSNMEEVPEGDQDDEQTVR